MYSFLKRVSLFTENVFARGSRGDLQCLLVIATRSSQSGFSSISCNFLFMLITAAAKETPILCICICICICICVRLCMYLYLYLHLHLHLYLYLLRRHHHSGTSSPGLTSGPSPPHQVLILKIYYPLFIIIHPLFINRYFLFIIHHPLPSSLKAWTTRPPRLQLLVCAASKRICSERSGSTASPIYPGEENLGNVRKSKEVITANPSKSSSAKRLKY